MVNGKKKNRGKGLLRHKKPLDIPGATLVRTLCPTWRIKLENGIPAE
ncbi:MAG: hypothetical protein JXA71_08460 [Chitinispirillaceae bacterium]|nr:hypothetical protein [Chitinispirillaceae bacterium]